MAVNLQTFSIVLFTGLVAASFLSISIKRSLLGYEPDQLTRVFVRQREVLDSLEEGLLAVDQNGRVILVNQAAETMLELRREEAEAAPSPRPCPRRG